MQFSHPLSRLYWKQAAGTLRQPRLLAVSSLLLASSIAIASVFIPLPANLRVYFTFLPKALCGAICGPVCGLVFGAAADLLGYVIHPTGAYFFGYTISSMTGLLIYGLGLFRAKITLPRIALTKLCVNLLCNVGLGVLWNSILYQKAYTFYLWTSLGKNLALWPLETMLLWMMFQALKPFLQHQKLLPRENTSEKNEK